MTSLIFQGGTTGWYLAGSWLPQQVPQPGDVMSIGSGNATISATDVVNFGTIDTEQLLIGSTSTAAAAAFSADGASFGSAFDITSSGSGFAALDFTGSVSFAGSIGLGTAGGATALNIAPDATTSSVFDLTGSVSVSGGDSLSINGGTLVENGYIAVADGELTIGASASVQGTGTITIGAGGTVMIDGPIANGATIGSLVAPGLTIDFQGASGTLDLADPLGFNGAVTNFVKGDVIDLIDAPSYKWFYSTTKDTLTVYGANSAPRSQLPEVASFGLTSNTTLTTQQIFVGQDGNGGSLVQLADIRTWVGGSSGEWYSTANWTTSGTLSANSYPLFGDTAIITNGTATISAADFAQFGSLDNESVLLSVSGAGLAAFEGTLGSDLTIFSAAPTTRTTLTFDGITQSSASIEVTGANSTLGFAVGDDGTTAGDFVNNEFGTVLVSTESALDIASGRLTNDGQIILNGAATIEATATVDGNGVINFFAPSTTLTVAGSVGPDQQVSFDGDRMNVAVGAQFSGVIENFVNGDTIDLQGVIANYASYDSASNVLTLRDGGASGSIVAQLTIDGSYGASDFGVGSDGANGTFITDTIVANINTLTTMLPAPAVVTAGDTVGLATLLTNSFGANFLATDPEVEIWSPSQADLTSFSYWDPSQPSLPYWTINGTIVAPDNEQPVLPADLASVDYVGGNLIWAGAEIQVPVAFDNGAATDYIDYEIQTFASQFAQSSLHSGTPTPADVVSAAEAFAAAYTNVPNTEDCFNIAHEVAAAAGATMVYQTYSPDPQDNVAGGFWRIAYAAPQNNSAVVNWGSLVVAGDILRIGWEGGGQHSFTVIDPLDQNGSITVFDNIYYASSNSYEAIGIHAAAYWSATDPDGTTNPEQITIFRLDPNDLYLVDAMTSDGGLIQNLPSAIVQGTTNNDLIIAAGTANIISGGGGDDVFADTSTILNHATITDFGAGDTIDFTDLDSTVTSVGYDPNTGLLDVISNGATVADLLLPIHLVGTFEVNNDGGTAGLDGNSLGTLYADLFVGPTPDGSVVSLVTCFLAGTRIVPHRATYRLRISQSATRWFAPMARHKILPGSAGGIWISPASRSRTRCCRFASCRVRSATACRFGRYCCHRIMQCSPMAC